MNSNINDEIVKEGINEKKYKVHLTCSKETADAIMKNCVKEFLEHHPDFEGMKISQGFILKQIAEHYLRSP